MGYAVPIAMTVGYLGGIALTYFCGRLIIRLLGARVSFTHFKRNLAGVLGLVGGAASLLPALFLGTVVGGNLGGAYGEVVSRAAGLGMSGVPIGLAAGIAVVTAVVASIGVLLGAAVGKLINGFVGTSAT